MRSITNLTFGALLCFFAVTATSAARRTEIRMADYGIVPGTGQDLTPALNRALASLYCEPLYRVASDYTARAVLAADAQNSGTTLTVTLAGASFSDGAALSAADVVYSFERAKESDWYASRLSSITAARAAGSQVVFTLTAPDVYAVNLLTFPIVRSGTGRLGKKLFYVFNYSSSARTVTLPAGKYTDLLSGRQGTGTFGLEKWGVAILEKG